MHGNRRGIGSCRNIYRRSDILFLDFWVWLWVKDQWNFVFCSNWIANNHSMEIVNFIQTNKQTNEPQKIKWVQFELYFKIHAKICKQTKINCMLDWKWINRSWNEYSSHFRERKKCRERIIKTASTIWEMEKMHTKFFLGEAQI